MFQGMEYVYEVYKEKSFSKAAANLFISQPSLSANVRRVEARIGYPVFDRSTKPLGLTECGEQYIRCVERMMNIEKDFSDFINDWGGLKTGTLVLGGSNLFSSWILPPLMADFAALYPQIQIRLVEESTVKLTEMLQSGSIDLVLDNTSLNPEIFDSVLYQEEHLILAVPGSFSVNDSLQDFQLSVSDIQTGNFLDPQVPSVPVSRFKKEPFIMLKQENDTGKRALEICRKNHFEPVITFEMDQQMTSYNVTCSGMGISFIGDIMITKVTPNPNVIYYKLPLKDNCRNICFYWKKGRYLSRAMEEFLKMCTQNSN